MGIRPRATSRANIRSPDKHDGLTSTAIPARCLTRPRPVSPQRRRGCTPFDLRAERPLSGVLAHPGNWERAEFLVLFSEMEIRVSLHRVLCLFSEMEIRVSLLRVLCLFSGMEIRDSLHFALNKTLFE
jgi:hypothetical protein